MAGEIAYKLSAEEKQVIDAFRKIAEGAGGVESGIKKISEESRRAQREQEEMGRIARRALQDAQTPAERYQKTIEALNSSLAKGSISVEEHGKAVAHVRKEYEETAIKGDNAFGPAALEKVKAFALGLVSVTAVLGTIKKGMEELGRMKDQAAQHARESEFGYGSLAELSQGDPKRFQHNVAEARRIAADAGMNENQAARLRFALVSAGASDEQDTYVRAYREGVVKDPEVLLRSATAMRRAFGNRMSNEQLLDIAFKASEGSPSQATALLSASAEAGAYARMSGIDEKQLLAATAVNASVLDTTGGAQTGGTGVRALLKAMGRLTAPQEAAPAYSEEEFQKDRENLSQERSKALSAAHHAAERDPEYLARFQQLREERARISHLPHAKGGRPDPKVVAERDVRLKGLDIQEREALEQAKDRAEQSAPFRNISSSFKMREEALVARRKASKEGISTDDEGNVLDEETKKIRLAAGAAIKKAGPNLISQLHAINAMGLNNAQLQKVFGRSEGLVAMSNLLANEQLYSELVTAQEGGKGYFRKVLSLPSTDQVLRGAKLQRIGESKKLDSDRQLGVEKALFDAVLAKEYSESSPLGKVWQTLSEGMMHFNYGRKGRRLMAAVEGGELESEPELLRAVVENLGGEEAAYGRDEDQFGYGARDRMVRHQRYRKIMGLSVRSGFEKDTADLKQWEGATDLTKAIGELKRATEENTQVMRDTQPRRESAGGHRSTLGNRSGDPGDKHR